MVRAAISQELSQSDSVRFTVLESIFDGVYIVDRERKIIFWNRAAEETTGHLRKDVLGRHVSTATMDEVMDHLQGVSEGHARQTRTVQVKHRSEPVKIHVANPPAEMPDG